MKKLFTIALMFIMLSVTAQNENKEVKESNVSETERIVDKYSSKLAENFSQFMETATPMAQEGFKVVVRLQIAKGICKLLFIPLSFFCIWFFYKNYNSMIREEKDTGKDVSGNDWRIGAMVISGLIGIISIITALFQTSSGLQMLIAPEWFALKEITTLF